MSQLIIGLTGEIASGKEVVKKYLIEHYAASSHHFSASLRDVLKRLTLPTTRENLQSLSTSLRQSFGEDLLAKVIAEEVKLNQSPLIVVDGIRREADLVYLKQLPNFVLVGVETDLNIRYERLKQRQENADDFGKSYEDFLADSQQETEREIAQLISTAPNRLNNNGSLADLYSQIDELMNKLKSSYV
ncbi:MAG: AAA family ATPase [Patescibacteria group bacterium]|jgi:dephospho-CoA kinase